MSGSRQKVKGLIGRGNAPYDISRHMDAVINEGTAADADGDDIRQARLSESEAARLENELEKASAHFRSGIQKLREAARDSAALRNVSAAIRDAEIAYLIVRNEAAKQETGYAEQKAKKINISGLASVSVDDVIFRLSLPYTLPKRDYMDKTSYYSSELTRALADADLGTWEPKQKFVIWFRQEYDYRHFERLAKDNDNVEAKWIIDAMIGSVIADDHPRYCDLFYTSSPGRSDRTEVLVIPEERFPEEYHKRK